MLYILICLVFLLALFEGFFRLAFSIDPIAKRLLMYDTNANWRIRWVNRHRDSIEIYFKFDKYDRTKGWISKPDLRNVTFCNNKILNTNSKGLRGSQEYPYDKNPNKPRILILGDSFTFGDKVSDDETY